MCDPSPYASAPLPTAVPAPALEPGDRAQALVRGAVAVVMGAAGILCQLFGAGVLGSEGFPSNAPVEMAMNFGITLVLIGGAIALMIAAIRAAAPRVVRPVRSPSVLGLIGTGLVAIALVAFVSTAGNWIDVLNGIRGRYDGLSGGLFLAGFPWIVGTVFATIGLRTPGTLSRIICGIGVGVGLLLTVPAVAAAALYAAGVTD